MSKVHCVLVLACFMAACGGDDDSVSIDTLFDDIADAQCSFDVRCGLMPDAATCAESNVFEGNDLETLVARVKDKTVGFDSGAAADCVAFLRDEPCTFTGFNVHNPCGDIFTGSVAKGGACNVDFECSGLAACDLTDTNCDPSTACCAGTCGDDPVLQQAGGPCNDNVNICDENLFCQVPAAGGAGTCTALIAAGQACDDIFSCANPTYCNVDLATGMGGTCIEPAGTDETCDPNELIPCGDLTQFCDTAMLKCVDKSDVGGGCDGANGSECLGFASCTNMACVADPSLGDTCDAANGPDCLGDLSCTGGACVAPAPGTACPKP